MPVIKAEEARDKAQNAEVLRFSDIEAEARQIIEAARAEAAAIIQQAKRRAEQIQAEAHRAASEEGYKEGFQNGVEAGKKQALQQAKAEFAAQQGSLLAALQEALGQFEARRRAILAELERDAVALAGAIAWRVAKVAVEVDPGALRENLRQALQLVAARSDVEIRLHPDDLESAKRFAEGLLSAQEYASITFVADGTVDRGGALLRTTGGLIDAGVQTQWARVMDEILADWKEHWLIALTGDDDLHESGSAGAQTERRRDGEKSDDPEDQA